MCNFMRAYIIKLQKMFQSNKLFANSNELLPLLGFFA